MSVRQVFGILLVIIGVLAILVCLASFIWIIELICVDPEQVQVQGLIYEKYALLGFASIGAVGLCLHIAHKLRSYTKEYW